MMLNYAMLAAHGIQRHQNSSPKPKHCGAVFPNHIRITLANRREYLKSLKQIMTQIAPTAALTVSLRGCILHIQFPWVGAFLHLGFL